MQEVLIEGVVVRQADAKLGLDFGHGVEDIDGGYWGDRVWLPTGLF